jgi:16S rRNA (guanine527-N7)-methyltransferase
MTNPSNNDVAAVLAAAADLAPRFDGRALRIYVEELVRWNPQLGLVSKRETPRVVARLLRESVSLWDFVAAALSSPGGAVRRVVDIGSGAGFPGLVWSGLDPSLSVELLERKDRKVTFLERVIARTAALDVALNVTATAQDLREFARRADRRASFDLAVMMAVADPTGFAASVATLVRVPGYFCVVRGRDQVDPGDRLGSSGFRRTAMRDTPDGRFLLYEIQP